MEIKCYKILYCILLDMTLVFENDASIYTNNWSVYNFCQVFNMSCIRLCLTP